MDFDNSKVSPLLSSLKTTVHTSRTIMLAELIALLAIANPNTDKTTYRKMITEDNVLNKPTLKTRQLTAERLGQLYLLDSQKSLFRVMRQLWYVDGDGRPLLAFLMACKTDTLLRLTTEFILGIQYGEIITSSHMEKFLEEKTPERFGKKTLRSVSQNLNSSFTQAGYLSGKVRKKRVQAKSTPGNTAYALFLAYLDGFRSERLFESFWTKLLDIPPGKIHELAIAASRKGWLDYRSAGGIIDVQFRNLLTEEEKRMLHD